MLKKLFLSSELFVVSISSISCSLSRLCFPFIPPVFFQTRNFTLDDAIRHSQSVWNLSFRVDDSVTTSDIHFFDGEKIFSWSFPETHLTKVSNPRSLTPSPFFSLLGLDGKATLPGLMNPATSLSFISSECREKMLRAMISQRCIDKFLLAAQRQGRISFYLSSEGEEAAAIGVAAGIESHDEVYLQYREAGLLTYRGYSIASRIAQCMGNCEDPLKGRQMPIHYGDPSIHVQAISSPLATQMPHAAGAGYAFRLESLLSPSSGDGRSQRIAVCFIGDGGMSEGDSHAGLHMASCSQSHTLFVVRNNGYAISTPTNAQYKGSNGMIARGVSYGIPSLRVDGMDGLAVYQATKLARELILSYSTPVLLELMTYRFGDHSSSDDSTKYRSLKEIEFMRKIWDPLDRYQRWMINSGEWLKEKTKQIEDEISEIVRKELHRQEKLPPPRSDEVIYHVYHTPPPHLRQQQMIHWEAESYSPPV